MLNTVKQFLTRGAKRYSGSRYCPICAARVRRFEPLPSYYFEMSEKYGYVHAWEDFETCNLKEHLCPSCGASDRDRLAALFLKEELARLIPGQRYSLVEFAPVGQLRQLIAQCDGIAYRAADRFRTDVDDQVDIQDLRTYAAASVDFILCSHVLEHVENDGKALLELFRILKPGGWAILMVPIVVTLAHTHEDPALTSEADRWKYFAQGDHLRLYSRGDFVNKISQAGLVVNQLGAQYFGPDVFRDCGIARRSILYVARKEK